MIARGFFVQAALIAASSAISLAMIPMHLQKDGFLTEGQAKVHIAVFGFVGGFLGATFTAFTASLPRSQRRLAIMIFLEGLAGLPFFTARQAHAVTTSRIRAVAAELDLPI